MRLSETTITQIAEKTDGFSFAYLKELIISSMMHWMQTMEAGEMEKSIFSQLAILQKQMSSTTVESETVAGC